MHHKMMNMITNNEIKKVKSLQQKKFRDELGLFVVEGEKMVQEALMSDFEAVGVYRRDEIGDEAMARISSLSSPSPVLAVLKQKPQMSDDDIRSLIGQGMLAIGLDSVRDPGNLGTIVRLADWFGIDAIFCSRDTVDIYNPKVVQSTMGAIFRKKVIYCDLSKVCSMFASAGMDIYGTFLEGESIYKAPLASTGLVVMGNEANGISDVIKEKVTSKLFIPPYPGDIATSESLNVAIATAITISEFRRR